MTAPYNYHIGVDYHRSYSHLIVQDSREKTLRSGRVKNDRQSLGSVLARYRENSHAVMEAIRNWLVMYDWLDDICDDVVLAHSLKPRRSPTRRSRPTRSTRRCWRICSELIWCRRHGLPGTGCGSCASHFGSGCSMCGCAR
ncbi:conserved hypothetical protein [Agrobacterium deltaense RV3]|nr:conserved hypothetical protein [Agrobacterium deltaense RV3]